MKILLGHEMNQDMALILYGNKNKIIIKSSDLQSSGHHNIGFSFLVLYSQFNSYFSNYNNLQCNCNWILLPV